MNLAIASGKGGTGKTTISTSLALSILSQSRSVNFFDCDVEAPNVHLFLHPNFEDQLEVNLLVPTLNEKKCAGCGLCEQVCEFNAILMLANQPLIFPELCHSCGGCTLVCPETALIDTPLPVGKLEFGTTKHNINFSHGVLNIGQPMAVPIISRLKELATKNDGINIFDSPPGTSCPVVETLRNSDFIILVTEPTPFGLHDLKLAHSLTQQLGIPSGVIINKDEDGFSQITDYCNQNNLEILMRIPFKKEYSQIIATGESIVENDPTLKKNFENLFIKIQQKIDIRDAAL